MLLSLIFVEELKASHFKWDSEQESTLLQAQAVMQVALLLRLYDRLSMLQISVVGYCMASRTSSNRRLTVQPLGSGSLIV